MIQGTGRRRMPNVICDSLGVKPVARFAIGSDEDLCALLRQIAQGDRVAFEELYQETSPKFLSIVTRMTGDEDRALDVLQDAYTSIWKHADRFDPEKGRAFTWMLVIMKNRALDTLRSHARTDNAVELTADLPDAAEGPETVARRSAIWPLVQRQLETLPENVASAITLRVCYGCDYEEIGKTLRTSPNTVKSWVRRGLIRLRNELPVKEISAII